MLSCQHQITNADDELLFIVVHQVMELWFKLAIHELEKCIAHLMKCDGTPPNTLIAHKKLARIAATQEVLLRTWHVLDTLTPDEFETFRMQVGRNEASGFQSYQYRIFEFLLGMKSPKISFPYVDKKGNQTGKSIDIIKKEGRQNRPKEVVRQMVEAYNSPSLYDAVINHLSKNFIHVAVRKPDKFAKPYDKQPGVLDAWETVYTKRHEHIALYHLAEKLIELESSFRHWRFLHLSTVARVIGNVTGTGKSPGLPHLRRKVDESFDRPIFPELWDVRQRLFNPEGFDLKKAGYLVERKATSRR